MWNELDDAGAMVVVVVCLLRDCPFLVLGRHFDWSINASTRECHTLSHSISTLWDARSTNTIEDRL